MMANYSDNSVDISKYLQDESHISKKNSQKYTGEFIIKAKPVNQKIYRKNFKRYLDIDIKNRKLYERLKYIQQGRNKSQFKDIDKHQKQYDKFTNKLYNLPPIRPSPSLQQKQIERQNQQLVKRIIQMKSQVKKQNGLDEYGQQQAVLAKKNHQSESDILGLQHKNNKQQQKQKQQDDFEEETEEVKITKPKSESHIETKIKGILFVNVVGLNSIDKAYQEFLYQMNARIHVLNHFKKIETNLNQIYSDCQILWNKKDHLKLNIDIQNLKEQELMVELNLEAKEQIGNLKVELAHCIANPGSWINRNFRINSDDGHQVANIYLQIQWREQFMALNYLEQPKIKYKFEGLVFQKEKYYISSSKKQQKHNFQLKESIKNISLIDYERMDSNYLYIQVVSAKSLNKIHELSMLHQIKVDKMDPFVKYSLSQQSVIYEGQTEAILNSQNPLWNHQRLVKLDKNSLDVKKPLKLGLKVYDYDFEKNTLVGEKEVSVLQMLMFPGKWFNQILFLDVKKQKSSQQIYVQMQFRPKDLVDYSKAPKRLL